MTFDGCDLDWAMGELLELFSQANRLGIYPHELNPGLFYAAWSVMSWQQLDVAQHCYEVLMAQITRPLHHLEPRSNGKQKKRYAYALTH